MEKDQPEIADNVGGSGFKLKRCCGKSAGTPAWRFYTRIGSRNLTGPDVWISWDPSCA
jgi:hypothetical protein